MKKFPRALGAALLLSAVFLPALAACAPGGGPAAPELSPAPPAGENSDAPAVTELYRAVLRGEAEFLEIFSGELLDISRVQAAVTSDAGITIEPDLFTAVDLDGDGAAEAVLSLSINHSQTYGCLVLYCQDGVVYGCPFSQRQLGELRADGTFAASGGAADMSICRLAFEGDTYSIDPFTYCSSEGGGGEVYFVAHQEAEEEEFERAFSEWAETPYATWYALTNENIDMILGTA